MRFRGERLVPALLLVLAALLPTGVPGCGPFTNYAVFVNTLHPDYPFGPYAAGDLGVVMPTYPRSYLAVAYRCMSGVPYGEAERAQLLRLWDDRLTFACWGAGKADWPRKWAEARKAVAGEEPTPLAISPEKDWGEYRSFVNCNDAAFEKAVETLQGKIARYGEGSSQVREWLLVQDTVFANCGGGEAIPSPAPPGAPPEQRADRAYQIAAARFYAGQYDDAANAFAEIAKDPSSPYRTLAPYLAARCLIRKADLLEPPDRARSAALFGEAETRLKAALADPALQAVHASARRLLDFVALRTRPQERLAELERALMKPGSRETLYQNLWDYTVLLDHRSGAQETGGIQPNEQPLAPAPPVKTLKPAVGDLSDWVLTFQQTGPQALRHAVERWRQTKSAPWLAAALTKAGPNTPELSELLSAAQQIPPGSPAYATAAYHRARLLLQAGKVQEARALADEALSGRGGRLPRSAANLFLSLRLQIAPTLEAFLADAPRAAAVCESWSYGDIPDDYDCGEERTEPAPVHGAFFDADAARAFNTLLPLDTLASVARDSKLPRELRGRVAASAFVRAVLLDRADAAASVAPALGELLPETALYAEKYLALQAPEERAFYATYALLKLPGLEPYVREGAGRDDPPGELNSFRDNWWCADASLAPEDTEQRGIPFGYSLLKKPAFVTPEMERKAAEESASLARQGSGTVALCARVLDWAQKSPGDPLVPEALHRAVVATKLGACKDEESSRYSKRVFQLLHKSYPKSEWAKKTPYYY